jgi:hypothetical protein
MSSQLVYYLGVDISSGQAPYMLGVYHGGRRLELLEGVTLEEVLEWAAAEGDVYLAVNAPSQLNQGLLAKPGMLPGLLPEADAQSQPMRLVEYELKQIGLLVGSTPGKLEDCPRWMRRGFTLYERLGKMGFTPYGVPSQESDQQWLEISADAAFQRLLKCAPYRARTIEGRLQRQLLLYENRFPVPDPMAFLEEVTRYRLLHGILPLDELHSASALNALLAAYMAYQAHQSPGKVMRYGTAQEGVITLPA